MSRYQTDDEVLSNYKQVMGEETGTFYHRFRNRTIHLHFRWHEYVELYGKTQAEFNIMNSAAPHFFAAVQDIWWQSILLAISRFPDNDIVAGRQTLSLKALVKLIPISKIGGVPHLVEIARSKAKFAQDWRNRAIAHTDLHHELDKAAKPLETANRIKVREALGAIAATIDAVEFHFTQSSTYWGDTQSGDGSYLLRQLKIYKRLEDERETRMMTGQMTADDQDWDKWHGKF